MFRSYSLPLFLPLKLFPLFRPLFQFPCSALVSVIYFRPLIPIRYIAPVALYPYSYLMLFRSLFFPAQAFFFHGSRIFVACVFVFFFYMQSNEYAVGQISWLLDARLLPFFCILNSHFARAYYLSCALQNTRGPAIGRTHGNRQV